MLNTICGGCHSRCNGSITCKKCKSIFYCTNECKTKSSKKHGTFCLCLRRVTACMNTITADDVASLYFFAMSHAYSLKNGAVKVEIAPYPECTDITLSEGISKTRIDGCITLCFHCDGVVYETAALSHVALFAYGRVEVEPSETFTISIVEEKVSSLWLGSVEIEYE